MNSANYPHDCRRYGSAMAAALAEMDSHHADLVRQHADLLLSIIHDHEKRQAKKNHQEARQLKDLIDAGARTTRSPVLLMVDGGGGRS